MLNSLLLRLAGLSIVHTLAAGLIVVGIYYFSLYDDGASLDVNLKKIETELKAEQDKEKEVQQAYLEQEKIKKGSRIQYRDKVFVGEAIITEIGFNRDNIRIIAGRRISYFNMKG
jgi:hypothetical protein